MRILCLAFLLVACGITFGCDDDTMQPSDSERCASDTEVVGFARTLSCEEAIAVRLADRVFALVHQMARERTGGMLEALEYPTFRDLLAAYPELDGEIIPTGRGRGSERLINGFAGVPGQVGYQEVVSGEGKVTGCDVSAFGDTAELLYLAIGG